MPSISKNKHATSNEHAFNKLVTTIANPNYLITKKADIPLYKRMKRPSAVCLDNSKWLHYNSKAIKYLIFDIDHLKRKAFLMRFGHKLIDGYSWLIDTDKGCQLCFALRDPIPVGGGTKATKSFLNAIKRKIVDDLEADAKGSMRNIGLWRNPLTHDGIVDLSCEYTLTDLAQMFDVDNPYKRKYDNATKTHKTAVTPLNPTIKGNVEGNRNNALYWCCVKQINATPDISESDLGDWAVLINAKQAVPLDEAEAHKTGRSAWRQYHVYGKRLFLKPKDKKDWKTAYNKRYYEKQKRGDEMTREENAKQQAKLRAIKAKNKVRSVVESMQFLKEKITVAAVARNAELTRPTVTKYMKQLKEEGLV